MVNLDAVRPQGILRFAMVGNAIEWFEFGVYGYLARTLGAVFFPESSREAQLLSSFAVFASGFLLRPVGGLVFGRFGDRKGRYRALTSSIMLMALCTVCIGVCPSYAQAGLVGSALICVLRMIQGLAVGGEYSGSLVYLYEHAPLEKRNSVTSYAVLSTVSGLVLGSSSGMMVYGLCTPDQIRVWGWRIPFLAAGIAGFITFLMRRYGHETPAYIKIAHRDEITASPLHEVIVDYPKVAITCVGLLSLQAVGFYLIYIMLPASINYEPSFWNYGYNTGGMLIMCVCIPLMGRMTDKYGNVKMHFIAIPLYSIIIVLLWFLNYYDAAQVGMLQAVLAVPHAMITAATPSWLGDAFPVRIRYTAVALVYNFGMSVCGGLAPVLALFLGRIVPTVNWVASIILCGSVISLLSARKLARVRATVPS